MTERIFYIRDDDQIRGPFPESQLKRLQEKRLISPECLISENRVSWQTYAEVFPIAEAVIPIKLETEPEAEPETEPETEPEAGPETEPEAEDVVIPPQPRVVPDPVCATIGLIWNAYKHLCDLEYMEQRSREENTFVTDRNISYAVKTAFVLVSLQFLAAVLCIFSMMREHFAVFLLTFGVLFFGGMIFLLLENLLLAGVAGLKCVLPPFFPVMLTLCTASAVFCAGLPLFALAIVGIAQCPVFLRWVVSVFAGVVWLGELVNLIFGCIAGSGKTFGFSRRSTVLTVVFFALQYLAVFPAGYYLMKLSQKII